jgi:hypothetical protein
MQTNSLILASNPQTNEKKSADFNAYMEMRGIL